MMAPHNVPSIRSEALSYAAPQEKVAYGALLLVPSFCEGVYLLELYYCKLPTAGGWMSLSRQLSAGLSI